MMKQNQKQKKNSKLSTKPILLYLIQLKEKNMMLVDMMMIQVEWVVDTVVELVEQTLHRYFKCSSEEEEEVVILLEVAVVIAIVIMEEDNNKEAKDNNFFNKTLEEWVVIPSNLNFSELLNFIYIFSKIIYNILYFLYYQIIYSYINF